MDLLLLLWNIIVASAIPVVVVWLAKKPGVPDFLKAEKTVTQVFGVILTVVWFLALGHTLPTPEVWESVTAQMGMNALVSHSVYATLKKREEKKALKP